jgi:hypothetical protein
VHKADLTPVSAAMSAFGPKQTWSSAPHMSAFGGKADMACCGNPLSRLLLGVKRTWAVALHMSAFDPKRTLVLHRRMSTFGGKGDITLTRPSNAPQRGFPSRTCPCVAHGLHYSYSCGCTPLFKMFVCPPVEGLNHRVI